LKTENQQQGLKFGMIGNLNSMQKAEIEKDFFAPGTKNLNLDDLLRQNQKKINQIKRVL